MKFTKEDAYKDLVAKLTAKGEKLNLSERSINEQLETLIALLANDEMELTDFLDKTMPLFKTADANVRNDVSVGIADFKKSYKPEEKKVVEEKKEEKQTDANAELLKRLSDLESKLKANEAKENATNLRNSFIAKSKDLGVKDEAWLNDYADLITYGEGFDVESKADACLKFYNKSKSTITTDVTPKTGGGKADDKRVKDVIAAAAAMAKAERNEA